MKIYLQYPWKFPDSPYYKYLLKEIPEEIKYLNVEKQKGVIVNKRFFWFSNFLKKYIRKFTKFLYPSMLNAHLSPNGNYDLIHCAHCLSKNTNKSWVFDMEAFWQFWISTKQTKLGLKKVEKILKRKNCKKILPWTEKIENEFINAFPKLKEKIERVYPAVPLMRKSKSFNKKELTLLFVGRYFYWKGGLHATKAIDKLTKKHPNIKGIVISDIPEWVKNKYSKNEKIKFYSLMSQKKVFDMYKKSDILIYPGYTDSFGFAYLEAMSFGIPIITVDGWSRKEIVSEGKTGFVIDRPKKIKWNSIGNTESKIIDDMVNKASLLIADKKILKNMSKNCIKEIESGKFSIKKRNKNLIKIYNEAIE